MKKIIVVLLILNISLFSKTINVAVAANVAYAIDDLKQEFTKHYPNIKVNITLGSSGKLATQIINGAPYDIFMSANMHYPQTLFEKNLAQEKPIVYAKGSLAILSTKDIDLSKNIKILENEKIKRVASGNPKTAPYGKATVEALKNSKIFDKISHKIIYAESISQTVSYTITATDIGFVAKSSLYSPKMSKYKNWIEVDPKLYTSINQGIVLLKNAKDSKEAKDFYTFILDSKAKKIFKKYGYQINE